MAPPSRGSLTTYSRRRTRRRELDTNGTQSSPLRPLSSDSDDVAFSVMANRMKKRARIVARSSIIAHPDNAERSFQTDDEDRPHKRPKAVPNSEDSTPWNYGYMRDIHSSIGSQKYTPRGSVPSDYCMVLSSAGLASSALDQLSPLPVAKRMLSRTSSSNLKENAGNPNSRHLASPFSSRPGSRTSSPDKNGRRRFGHYVKSRTFSQVGSLRENIVDRNVAEATPGVFRLPNSSAVGTAQTKQHAPAHNRSSSTPTLKPAIDRISSEGWLVPHKVLLRPAPAVSSDLEGDKREATARHSSFFTDVPMQVSTPPRRRRSATVGIWAHGLMPQLDADPPPPVRGSRYDSDVDMSDSSLPGSPSESHLNRADPPRRRRRTIVHLSSDSLFSSSFNFSAVLSETERFPRLAASEGSRSPEPQPPVTESDLGPPISLSGSPLGTVRRTRSDVDVTLTRFAINDAIFSNTSPGLRSESEVPSPPPSSPSSGSPTQASPNTDGDELLDLFSVLGLDEDEKWSTFRSVDDSGVAFPSQLHESNVKMSSVKTPGVRRKRGDTIRASDYTKFPVAGSSVSSASTSAFGSTGANALPRRTRSGTVTQASSSSGARHKHEGWPTIKMRTNAEPLRADESEDDELLLKDGDVIE